VPHVLIAADADWVIDDVRSALEGPDTTFAICRTGQAVTVAATQQAPDLAVLDLQIGNMGGMAVCLTLRLDESLRLRRAATTILGGGLVYEGLPPDIPTPPPIVPGGADGDASLAQDAEAAESAPGDDLPASGDEVPAR
jgi:CheY-like chemotaxis protein